MEKESLEDQIQRITEVVSFEIKDVKGIKEQEKEKLEKNLRRIYSLTNRDIPRYEKNGRANEYNPIEELNELENIIYEKAKAALDDPKDDNIKLGLVLMKELYRNDPKILDKKSPTITNYLKILTSKESEAREETKLMAAMLLTEIYKDKEKEETYKNILNSQEIEDLIGIFRKNEETMSKYFSQKKITEVKPEEKIAQTLMRRNVEYLIKKRRTFGQYNPN